MAGALFAHHRQNGSGDVHRADEVRSKLLRRLSRTHFLKESDESTGRVVDEYIDCPEPLKRRFDGGFGISWFGDIQFRHQKVFGFTDGLCHLLGVSAGRDNLMDSSQGCFGNIQAHAASGTSYDPYFAHSFSPFCQSL
jgi:hypothetical protein